MRLSTFKADSVISGSPPARFITTENPTKGKDIVKIGYDNDVIAACKYLVVENTRYGPDDFTYSAVVTSLRCRLWTLLNGLTNETFHMCFERHTKIIIKLALVSEVLPVVVESLRKLYYLSTTSIV